MKEVVRKGLQREVLVVYFVVGRDFYSFLLP